MSSGVHAEARVVGVVDHGFGGASPRDVAPHHDSLRFVTTKGSALMAVEDIPTVLTDEPRAADAFADITPVRHAGRAGSRP
jgi:hypothetical protein